MTKKRLFLALLCITLSMMAACTSEVENVNGEGEGVQQENLQVNKAESVTPEEDGRNNSMESIPVSILKPESEDIEEAAKFLLKSAFSFDATNSSPTITQADGISSLRYLKDESDPSDFFVVDFYKDYDFPMTLYHFCHSNEEEQIYIEKDNSFQFDADMEANARDFVKEVYGIDCFEADAHAYGYANKVSVQLDVAEGVIFQVRFYYKELEPVGVLYFTDPKHAETAMEANGAVQLL